MPGTFTVLGETSVALEDFVPPRIRVDVEAPNGPAQAGDTSLRRPRRLLVPDARLTDCG